MCGNWACESGETATSCPSDCGGGGGEPASITATANPASITINGTSTIEATVLDASGNNVADGTVVNFSTTFSGATVTPQASTTTGKAQATFTAGSTAGTATVNITSGSASGSVDITVLPVSTGGSIQFVSAEPTVIAVKGSGGQETSTITFKVTDSNGDPVADGTQVSFSIVGPGGGEAVSPSTVSTVSGDAITILFSGSKAGPVTIIATATIDPGPPPVVISASSTNVSIGGAVPDYDHLSVATNTFNLPGLSCYGERGTITAFVADKFGNPVPENTTVSFFTEAGAIITSGLTNAYGEATAEIQTQGPAPKDVKPSSFYEYEFPVTRPERSWDDDLFTPKVVRNPRDGVLTIIVMTLGQEGFDDKNGNGIHDTGESWTDLSEPFIDANDNGKWDPAESYTDTDGDGRYDPPERFLDAGVDGIFSGPYEPGAKGPDGEWGNAGVDDDSNGITDDVSEYLWPGSDDVADGSGDDYDAITNPTGTEGNGVFDAGEVFIDENANGIRDAGEPFTDSNGDGIWNDAEEFWDANVTGNTTGVFDPPNGRWDASTLIWKTIKILFTSGPWFFTVEPSSFTIPDGGAQWFKITVADMNMNPLNDTASLKVTTDKGKLAGNPNWDFPSTLSLGWTEFWVYLYDDQPGDSNPPESANLKLELSYQLGSCGTFDALTGAGGTID